MLESSQIIIWRRTWVVRSAPNQNLIRAMRITAGPVGRVLVVIGLGLACLSLTPTAVAAIDDKDLNATTCQTEVSELTHRQIARCAVIGVVGQTQPGEDVPSLLQRVVGILAWVTGVAAVFVILIQGLRMVFSGGDSIRLSRPGTDYLRSDWTGCSHLCPHLVNYITGALS